LKILVDSHAYVWVKLNDPRLSRKARSLLRSDEHELFFSIVSLWELSINIRLGRLRTLTSSVAFLHDSLAEDNITLLPLRYEDILALEHLEMHHRDPFDRILIAQALNHYLHLLTNDADIKLYKEAHTLW
jgi:PIN domain nuclease of toxin-antitoxin system